jgi:hypothetical protein
MAGRRPSSLIFQTKSACMVWCSAARVENIKPEQARCHGSRTCRCLQVVADSAPRRPRDTIARLERRRSLCFPVNFARRSRAGRQRRKATTFCSLQIVADSGDSRRAARCHCERSEAIQGNQRDPGLLRRPCGAPRNDVYPPLALNGSAASCGTSGWSTAIPRSSRRCR